VIRTFMYSPLQTTQIDGLQIAYRVQGQGPDLVLVHGWGSSGRMWQTLMNDLSPRFRCWALDLAGFGDSQKPPVDWYSISNYVRLVAAFMIDMGLKRPPLVGHSMGGMIGVTLAAEFPGLVSQMVAINPAVTGRTYWDLKLLSASPLSRPMLTIGKWVWPIATSDWRRTPAMEGQTQYDQLNRAREREHARARIREDWQKASSESTILALRAISRHNIGPRLPEISAPTLVIVGDRDLTLPNSEGRLIAQHVRGARLIVLPAGHLPTDDLPDTINRLIGDFLTAEQVWEA
jgi:pimeloyl-ACP methyl ester carboxylesterase